LEAASGAGVVGAIEAGADLVARGAPFRTAILGATDIVMDHKVFDGGLTGLYAKRIACRGRMSATANVLFSQTKKSRINFFRKIVLE
jgi:hypothetical protein